jgi:undecaprenyl pyrophosphate phosphatase UppP
VIGTAAANIVMTWLQIRRLKVGFNGRLDLDQTMMITARIIVASILTAVLARVVYDLVHALLGASVPGQLFAVGLAVLAGGGFYAKAVLAMRIPEARQIEALIQRYVGRMRGRAGA